VDNDTKSGAMPATLDSPGANPRAEIPMPKLSRWRRMQIPVIAWAAYGLMRILGPTLRMEVIGVHNAANLRDAKEPAIGAFWHQCIFPAIWIWRGRKIVVMNTVNFDGQWTRRVIERLGFGTAQGSSTRGAMEGLMVMAQRLEEGHSVAFTIDGPRGPRFVAKPGAVILARRTGNPVTVFHIALKRAHTLRKSWDLFQIPYPFSKAVMFIAPPIRVPADCGSDVVHEKQAEIQAALERVQKLADSWFGLSEAERDQVREEWRDKSLD
jgi:lysophospholipid acyltransferase (LPLAT)-like uncharacterized protein